MQINVTEVISSETVAFNFDFINMKSNVVLKTLN